MSVEDNTYRPDIDGLRAIAVLLVLFFHVEFVTFGGGFVGVDVFFVISNYLITGLLLKDIERGVFGFSSFYIRRARRLFPALVVTVTGTLITALFIFSPVHIERLGGAALHTILSISNFYFWSESGYFDVTSQVKPLLHTWSLGVEEQFYLFWPALIFLTSRTAFRWILPFTFVVLGLTSLAISVVFQQEQPGAVFYLLPFRVFEFAIGSLLVWLVRIDTPAWIKEIACALGLFLVVYAGLMLTDATPFPGFYALIPCVGSALVIYAKNPRFFGLLLRNPLARGLGLISYSMYLVHWPIYVFYTYNKSEPLVLSESVGIIVATIFLATAMYFLVEQPIRRPRSLQHSDQPAFGWAATFLCVAMLVAYPAAHMWANEGWTAILPRKGIVSQDVNVTEERAKRNRWIQDLCNAKDKGFKPEDSPRRREGCVSARKPNALIVGDSHAVDGLNIIYTAFKKQHNYLLSRSNACPPVDPKLKDLLRSSMDMRQRCIKMNKSRFKPDYYKSIDYVVISVHNIEPEVARTYVKFLHKIGIKKIILLGPFITLKEGMSSAGQRMQSVNQVVMSLTQHRFLYNDELSEVCKEEGCLFVNKEELMCELDTCKLSAQRIPFTWDSHHLSWEYARMIGARARESITRYVESVPEVREEALPRLSSETNDSD